MITLVMSTTKNTLRNLIQKLLRRKADSVYYNITHRHYEVRSRLQRLPRYIIRIKPFIVQTLLIARI